MEPTLAISIMMLVVMVGADGNTRLSRIKKIIKSMKRRSKKYMKEVVSND